MGVCVTVYIFIHRAAQLNGLSLLSLANQHIHDEKVPNAGDAASVCEDANIRWVGLNAKTHEVLKINGVKIGLLAFCGLYAACMEATSQPFTPTKYSTKAATVAVQELQQVSENIISLECHLRLNVTPSFSTAWS